MLDARQLGIYGELIAARYLRKKGYVVLQNNFRSSFGEIDLIVEKDDTIVFVEVKARDSSSTQRPMEAVNISKQQKIKKTSLVYLSTLEKEVNVRYDVIEILVTTKVVKNVKLNHIVSAFE